MTDKFNITLIFSKDTKEFLGFLENDDELLPEIFLYKDVEWDEEEFNTARYTWQGDFDNGSIVDLNMGSPIVSENEIDSMGYEKFWEDEDLTHILFDVFQLIIDSKLPANPRLEKTLNRYMAVRDKIAKDKEYFKTSPDHEYRSYDDIEQSFKKAFS